MIFSNKFTGESQILLCTIFFGLSFIGQKRAMDVGLGPLTYDACRFVGSALLLYSAKSKLQVLLKSEHISMNDAVLESDMWTTQLWLHRTLQPYICSETIELLFWGNLIGVVSFIALTLQQIGLVHVSATQAAFITSLYVIITPIIEHYMSPQEKKLGYSTWLAALLSCIGMYLLTGLADDGETTRPYGIGDLIIFVSMLGITYDIILSDIASKRVDCIDLTCYQFLVVAVLSVITAVIFEPHYWTTSPPLKSVPISGGWDMILLVSITEGAGVMFATLGQMYVTPSRASIIYSFEGVTTAIFAYIFLHETMTLLEFIGCALVFLSSFLTIDFNDDEMKGEQIKLLVSEDDNIELYHSPERIDVNVTKIEIDLQTTVRVQKDNHALPAHRGVVPLRTKSNHIEKDSACEVPGNAGVTQIHIMKNSDENKQLISKDSESLPNYSV
jgi:drug/metabolite transporter (DMT)-like permease